MAGVKNNPIKYRYPLLFFFSRLLLLKHSTIIHHVNQRPHAEHKLPWRFFAVRVFIFFGTLSASLSNFFVPNALIYVLHNYLELWWWNSLGFLFSPKKNQTNKTKTNTQPPKKSLCPIYHSLLTSCVVLIDHIALHIN